MDGGDLDEGVGRGVWGVLGAEYSGCGGRPSGMVGGELHEGVKVCGGSMKVDAAKYLVSVHR